MVGFAYIFNNKYTFRLHTEGVSTHIIRTETMRFHMHCLDICNGRVILFSNTCMTIGWIPHVCSYYYSPKYVESLQIPLKHNSQVQGDNLHTQTSR